MKGKARACNACGQIFTMKENETNLQQNMEKEMNTMICENGADVSLVTDEIAEAVVSNAEDKAARGYQPDDDPTKPDFDTETIDRDIENALYMELQVWKNRCTAWKNHLIETHNQIPMLQSLNKQVQNGDLKKTMTAAKGSELGVDELEVYNEMQRNGITMEMQIKSFLDKYEVNLDYLDKCLARIDERLETEAADLETSKTSEKNLQLIAMIEKHLNSLDMSNPRVTNAIKFGKAFINVCNTRTDLSWIGTDALGKGNSPKTLVRFYREMQKQGRCTIDEIATVLRFNTYPDIAGMEPEKVDFFWWYLIYLISKDVNKSVTKVSISTLAFKERVVALIQNVNDINAGLFDLRTTDDRDASGVYQRFEVVEGDNTEGAEAYLGCVREYVNQIYALAFTRSSK